MRLPKLDYLPRGPRHPKRHKLGLIGCGGISRFHLQAAQSFGVEVVAMADVNPDAAKSRRDEYFPKASLYADHRALLARDDITAVDIATHTAVRTPQKNGSGFSGCRCESASALSPIAMRARARS